MKNTIRTLKTTLSHQTAATRLSALPKLVDLMRRKSMIVLMMLAMSFGLALAGRQEKLEGNLPDTGRQTERRHGSFREVQLQITR